MDKFLWLMKDSDIKILNMPVNISANYGIVILSMGDQLLLHTLKGMTILYFRISKKKRGIGLIAIRKSVNILLIYESAKIRIVVNHHELLTLLNFYH